MQHLVRRAIGMALPVIVGLTLSACGDMARLPVEVLDLPAGPLNHHWTKNLIASPDGTRLYVTVGSNSNVAEHGIDKEEGRAAIWEVDIKTRDER